MAERTKCEICNRNFKDEDGLAQHNTAKHHTQTQQKVSRTPFVNSFVISKKMVYVAIIILAFLGLFFFIFTKSSGNTLLEVTSEDHILQGSNSRVTLIEYLDFECEVCGTYYPLLKVLKNSFGENITFVVRYFPLPGHKNSMNAALSVEAAAKQGKFWEMHDKLFENQKIWGEGAISNPQIFANYAKEIGLDMEQYTKDLNDPSTLARIERDKDSGKKLGVSGTPSFFLEGERIPNPRSYEEFKTLLNAAIIKAPLKIEETKEDKVHEHADFKVYLENKQFNFSQERYQSTEERPIDDDMHLHDGNGEIMHKHRKGKTLGYFFNTLGINFTKECLILDTGIRYCNENSKELKLIVNGEEVNSFENYELNDLDKILITYGADSEATINAQISSIKDDSCMYSEKCPERGPPPTEKCVGGLGDEC